MSFWRSCRALGCGKIFNQNIYQKFSLKIENNGDAPEVHDAERIDEATTRISPEPIKERIRAYLEPLNAQLSRLTQSKNQLIQDNSAKTTPTASPRTHYPQTDPYVLSRQPEYSKTYQDPQLELQDSRATLMHWKIAIFRRICNMQEKLIIQ